MDPIVDLYCERIAPGLWGEPLNALTNVAFLIAAWRVRHHQMSIGMKGVDLVALPLLIADRHREWPVPHHRQCMGRRFGQGLSRSSMLVYVCVFARRVGELPWRVAWLAAPAFAAFAATVTIAAKTALDPRLQGIGLSLAAWLGHCVLCAWAGRQRHTSSRTIALAAMLFVASWLTTSRCAAVPLCRCAASCPEARTSPGIS